MTIEEKIAAANAKLAAEAEQEAPEPAPTPSQVMAEIASQAEQAP